MVVEPSSSRHNKMVLEIVLGCQNMNGTNSQAIGTSTSFPRVGLSLICALGSVWIAGLLDDQHFAYCQSGGPWRWANDERVSLTGQAFLEDGQAIYRRLCAECHGDRGQGTEHYAEALRGDLSLEELAKYIEESMPEDDPDACVGDEARQVAAFIFEAFYSTDARRALESPPVQFARLTVRQFRESVADVLGHFSDPPWRSEERGLKAYYFAARYWTEDRKLAEQIDPTIDFGDGVPHFDPTGAYAHLPAKEKTDENKMNEGFCVYWSGSLLAPTTGHYRIAVHSKNGFQLRLNGSEPPLIDRKVRSDDIEEHEASIFLLAGRAYPLHIEFFSYPDPPARIRLMWQPPQGVREVIPESCLMPHSVPPSLAIATAFPPDDSSWGYERGTIISREWDEAVTAAATEAADWVADNVWRLAQIEENEGDRTEKVQLFARQFVESAFGRPLDEAEYQFFVAQHFQVDAPIKDQIKRVVLLALKSPRFLYPELESRDWPLALARRLALVLWDSVPDRQLYEAALNGSLNDEAGVEAQIERMIEDPRSRAKLFTFFHAWLKLDRAADATKDAERFPGFDQRLVADLRRSLEMQIESIVWSPSSDYRQLFLSDQFWVNRRLADYYGLPFPEGESTRPGDSWVALAIDPQTRLGLITHPYLMTGLAYYRDSSPIHRGVFVARSLLGRALRPPMENFEPLSEDFDPALTNRQRVEYQTQDAACMSCHQVINPLGFSLEQLDATGRFRTEEKGQVINATAVYQHTNGEMVQLRGAADLARFIAADTHAQRHFVRQLFRHYTGQPLEAFGDRALDSLYESFVASDYNICRLLAEIARLVTAERRDSHD